MQPSDHVFRLIKSLDPSEKGYFKKFATGYGKQQNYILLFDAIDKQQQYDEAALIRKFKAYPFVKQFAVAKNYLWELILRSQRQYRAEGSKFVQLNTLLENGEILFEKGLYEESLRAWDKAAKLAEAYDEKPFQLDIETARRRYFIDMTAGNWSDFTEPSYAKSHDLLNAYGQMLHIQQKYVAIVHCIKSQPYFRTEEQQAEWTRFMQDPALQVNREPADFYGKLYFYYIHNIYHLLCRNKEEALPWIRKVVALWDTHSELREMEPVKYISAVNNYLTNLLFLDESETYCQFFEQFTPPKGNTKVSAAIVYEHVWLMRSNYLHLRKDIDGLGRLVHESVEELERHAPYINKVRLFIIKFTMASYYTLTSRIETSNNVLAEILEFREIELRKDLQSLSRVLQMINHYSSGNLLLMEHLMRSAKHFMRKNDMYYDTEKLFFKHITQLVKAPDKETRKAVFSTMHQEVHALFKSNPSERIAFESMYFMEWIEQHL